jgi:hypothetical protein
MYGRATIAQFHPGTTDEAMSILRDIMLPKAKEQQGFKGALILSDAHADKGIIITLWETEADLLASSPPEEIYLYVQRLGELMAEQTTQHTYEVLLQM